MVTKEQMCFDHEYILASVGGGLAGQNLTAVYNACKPTLFKVKNRNGDYMETQSIDKAIAHFNS